MSARQRESNQVAGGHDRHDDAAWFHYQPNAAGPAPHGADADTFVRESMTLTHALPRSIPPEEAAAAAVHHGRSWSPSRSRSRSDSRDGHRSRGHVRGGSDSPLHHRSQSRSSSRNRNRVDRARDIADDKFTASATGIGASILGAVVGGFVANRASEALQSRSGSGGGGGAGSSRHGPDHANVPRIASTILGAVAGGLGANVLASHLEDQRGRSGDRSTWERQYSREEHHYRRTSRGGGYERDEEEYDFVYDAAGKHEPRPRSRSSDYRN